MKSISPAKFSGFTLVEVLIGMTLSLMVMGAVLSGYIFLARNFTRALGVSSANQPTLESQGRRTLAYFTQDVRMASGLVTTLPTAPDTFSNMVKLTTPQSLGATAKIILYYYNSAASSVYLHPSDVIDATPDSSGIEFPAQSLTRVVMNTSPRTFQLLHRGLLSCSFNYYDAAGYPYTIFDPSASGFSSLAGIKQIALSFSSQSGSRENGTQSPVYANASPRLILRNTPFSP